MTVPFFWMTPRDTGEFVKRPRQASKRCCAQLLKRCCKLIYDREELVLPLMQVTVV
jgi:hypothetical protein